MTHRPRLLSGPTRPVACDPHGLPGEDLARYPWELLGEARRTISDLVAGVSIAAAAWRAERLAAERAARPPADVDAERVVLGAALRCAEPVAVDLFAVPPHRELAHAVATGQLAETLLYPEMRGYRRGLISGRCDVADLRAAIDTLVALRAQRRALEAAERAVAALRDMEMGAVRGAIELESALSALSEHTGSPRSGKRYAANRQANVYTFRRR